MTIRLFDLAGGDDRRFSPYCWRAKMAIAHKGLAFEAVGVPFTGIPSILGGGQKTVPVLEDDGRVVADSFAIAAYLEEAYPDRPSLFGGPGGEASARFVEAWAFTALHPTLLKLLVGEIHDLLAAEDQPYFRESRASRLGQPIEAFEDRGAARVEELRERLAPLRGMLRRQPFIGGDAPLYHDYIVFGSLQWQRVVSPVAVLAADDPVAEWHDRLLDLHGGLGRRAVAS